MTNDNPFSDGINRAEDHTITEYGMRKPDGSTVWVTEWNATRSPRRWDTPEGRQAEQERFADELQTLGLVPGPQTLLVFLTRTRIVAFTNEKVIS